MNNNIKLQIIAGGEGGCAGGVCPTVYKSNNGKYYIQGYIVQQEIKNITSLGVDEDLVEISPELIEAIKKI